MKSQIIGSKTESIRASVREPSFKKKAEVFADKVSSDDVFTQAAALAYYTALSMAPLMILMISFLSFLNIDLQEQLLQQVQGLIGAEAGSVLQSILESANNRPDLSVAAGWIGAIILALSASVVFAQLQSSLNLIFKVDPDEKHQHRFAREDRGVVWSFVLRRLLSVGILLAFIFIAIVSLTISASLSYLLNYYQFFGIQVVSEIVNLIVFAGLFFLIYKWIPDRRVKTSNSALAGIITAVLFVIGKALIGNYLGQAAIGSAYGAAGSLIVLLAWIYYSALVFFLGAEFSAFFLIKRKKI